MIAAFDNHIFRPRIDTPNKRIEIKRVQPTLWRYLDEPYASEFVAGKIRLKTVSSYQEIEDLGRRDPFEGRSQGSLESGGIHNAAAWGFKGAVFAGGNHGYTASLPSFCLCLSIRDDIAGAFSNLTTVVPAHRVQVNDLCQFLALLDVAVRTEIAARGGHVICSLADLVSYYRDEQERFDAIGKGADIRLSKSLKDSHQAEYRAIWSFSGAVANPLPVTIATDLSSILELLPHPPS